MRIEEQDNAVEKQDEGLECVKLVAFSFQLFVRKGMEGMSLGE